MSYDLWMSWIEACIKDKHRLSDWERKFVFDIRLQLRSKKMLTDKQIQILERIYADKTE